MSDPTSFIRPEELWRDLGVSAGQTVVHLGSGPGFYLIPAAKIVGSSGKVIGVDILSNLLSEAQSRADREGVGEVVRVIRANLENRRGSTLTDNSADWVLVANILHQSDPAPILAEAARIVKTDGKVVVIEWDVSASPMGPPPEQRLSRQHIAELAQQANLKQTSEFNPSPYHYGYTYAAT